MPVFDSHAYVKKLVEKGVPEEQAEVHAEELKNVVEKDPVTKSDLDTTKTEINANTDRKIAELEVRIANRLMIFFGAFFFGTVGVTFTLFKLFLG